MLPYNADAPEPEMLRGIAIVTPAAARTTEVTLNDPLHMKFNLPVEVYAIENGIKEGRVSLHTAERALLHTLTTEALAYLLAFYRSDDLSGIESRLSQETYSRLEEHLCSPDSKKKAELEARHPEVDLLLLAKAFRGGDYSLNDVVFALSHPDYLKSINNWGEGLKVPA